MISLYVDEEDAIRNNKIKAIIRFSGAWDTTFSVDDKVYKIVRKLRWSMQRCAARRCTDWGRDVQEAKETIHRLYGYNPEDIVYLLIFKEEKSQRTLT